MKQDCSNKGVGSIEAPALASMGYSVGYSDGGILCQTALLWIIWVLESAGPACETVSDEQVLGYEGLLGTIGVAAVGVPLTTLLPGSDPGLCLWDARQVSFQSSVLLCITHALLLHAAA